MALLVKGIFSCIIGIQKWYYNVKLECFRGYTRLNYMAQQSNNETYILSNSNLLEDDTIRRQRIQDLENSLIHILNVQIPRLQNLTGDKPMKDISQVQHDLKSHSLEIIKELNTLKRDRLFDVISKYITDCSDISTIKLNPTTKKQLALNNDRKIAHLKQQQRIDKTRETYNREYFKNCDIANEDINTLLTNLVFDQIDLDDEAFNCFHDGIVSKDYVLKSDMKDIISSNKSLNSSQPTPILSKHDSNDNS